MKARKKKIISLAGLSMLGAITITYLGLIYFAKSQFSFTVFTMLMAMGIIALSLIIKAAFEDIRSDPAEHEKHQ